MENQRLLSRAPATFENPDQSMFDDGEWTEEESSYSSYCSDSDSTIPDWEPYIDDLTGELLYIECHPYVVQNNKEVAIKTSVDTMTRNKVRQSTRGKFLKLLRRRESKHRSDKNVKNTDVNETNTSKVKFQDFQEGEEKEVFLEIDSENRHNLSSDKSLAESLLGLIVSTLSDGNRVMVAGFSYDSKAKQERNIKIGDWLKSINNIEVNVQNIDDILQKFINRADVSLKLQRVAGIEVTKEPPINELNIESEYVKELLNKKPHEGQKIMQCLCEMPLGVIYVNTEKLSESNQSNEDVIYCYPKPMKKNILCNSRGIFITLNHLLEDVTKSKPKIYSMKHNGQLAHIVNTNFYTSSLLLMLPASRATKEELLLINQQLLTFMNFAYGNVDECMTSKRYQHQVDHFFMRFFTKTLSNKSGVTAEQFANSHYMVTIEKNSLKFEDVMCAASTLFLPEGAQIQIDDALSELEASDYKDWNEEPLDCQRLFTILGSAIFHSGYLIGNHFIHEDLIDVFCFCELQGLFHLSRTEPVKSLVLWKEVFPHSCDKLRNSKVKIPDGRRYLLVVECMKDLLAVIMEAGGCTEPSEENMEPDAFYVEEAQATLAHIQELGLGELCDRLLLHSPHPQIARPLPSNVRKKNEFMSLNLSKGGVGTVKDTSVVYKKHEVTSILKKKLTDQNFVAPSSSSNCLQDDSFDGHSEGSGSQGGHSEISDDSRRNFRRGVRYDSDEDDSETDEYGEGNQMTVSSFDISDIRQYILDETEDFRPIQLTSGSDKILFHYVQLESAKGIMLCPPEYQELSLTYDFILNNFRRCCLKIHSLFQNTIRFKKMPAQDIAKSVMNKSLIAIKEHGILFQCPYLDDEDNKKNKITYWVLGRLFYMPSPKEVYVCYQEEVPQNTVELAFKMSMTSLY